MENGGKGVGLPGDQLISESSKCLCNCQSFQNHMLIMCYFFYYGKKIFFFARLLLTAWRLAGLEWVCEWTDVPSRVYSHCGASVPRTDSGPTTIQQYLVKMNERILWNVYWFYTFKVQFKDKTQNVHYFIFLKGSCESRLHHFRMDRSTLYNLFHSCMKSTMVHFRYQEE